MEKNFLSEDLIKALENDKKFKYSVYVPQQIDESGEKWGIRIGSKLATDDIFKSEEEAQAYISHNPFKLIFSLCCAVSENTYTYMSNQNK